MPVASQRGGGSTNSRGRGGGLRNPGIQPLLWNMIRAYAPRLGLDPYAVAAVSRVEGGGRFGEVGDGGTSFGPFQLHVGGALPPGKNAAWANSAAGVLYAMQHMSAVARGLRGLPAVQAIVTRFERPAAPGPEVQNAWAGYKSFGAPLTGAPLGTGGGSGLPQNIHFQMPGLGDQWIKALHAQMAQQAQMFQTSQQNLLKQLAQQAAQTRQQNLAAGIQAQAQQRIQQGQLAQQQVSGAGSLTASGVPAQGVFDQRKTILDTIRNQALRRAGIL